MTRIEHAVYRFFWNDKHPLVNRGILSLSLKEGGFNVARLELKMKALRLYTLRRLLTGEEAHWKHFTSHFVRVSVMHLGKLTLTLATDFAHVISTVTFLLFTGSFFVLGSNARTVLH